MKKTSKLESTDYCSYYASKCKECKGARRVWKNDIWMACGCQYIASVKWRFEQIDVFPPSLKYLSWKDFTGDIKAVHGGKSQISNQLDMSTFIHAKKEVLKYCFNSSDISVLDDRQNKSAIFERYAAGDNIIISGSKKTGKSLLATLILKEVVYASVSTKNDLSFEWISWNELLEAARWDTDKPINSEQLYLWSDIDFLVIDGIARQGGHTTPPDLVALNSFFVRRRHLPTIIVASTLFVYDCRHPIRSQGVEYKFGSELLSLISGSNNFMLALLNTVEKPDSVRLFLDILEEQGKIEDYYKANEYKSMRNRIDHEIKEKELKERENRE